MICTNIYFTAEKVLLYFKVDTRALLKTSSSTAKCLIEMFIFIINFLVLSKS